MNELTSKMIEELAKKVNQVANKTNRQERIALHKKQERLQTKNGVPSLGDLTEGVPQLRSTSEGLVEYVRHKGEIFKKVLDKGSAVKEEPGKSASSSVLIPDFDSGWVNVTKEAEYEFVHNLGSKILLQQWYFKSDAGDIFNVQTMVDSVFKDDDIGIWVEMETIDQISVGTGNTYIYIVDQTAAHGVTATRFADGFLRCLLWKTGL